MAVTGAFFGELKTDEYFSSVVPIGGVRWGGRPLSRPMGSIDRTNDMVFRAAFTFA